MSQIKRKAAVNADWLIDLDNGDFVAANPSNDVVGELVGIVAAAIPHGRSRMRAPSMAATGSRT
jgi:uncharacterized oligopeptide transporter (OPT) family protein